MQLHECRCRLGCPSLGFGGLGGCLNPQQQTDHQALPDKPQKLHRHFCWLSRAYEPGRLRARQ